MTPRLAAAALYMVDEGWGEGGFGWAKLSSAHPARRRAGGRMRPSRRKTRDARVISQSSHVVCAVVF